MVKRDKKQEGKNKKVAYERSKEMDERKVIERASQEVINKYMEKNVGKYNVRTYKDLMNHAPFLAQFRKDMIDEGHQYPPKSLKRRVFLLIIKKIDNMGILEGGMINNYLEQNEERTDPRLENHQTAVKYTKNRKTTLERLLSMPYNAQKRLLDLMDDGYSLEIAEEILKDPSKTKKGGARDDDDSQQYLTSLKQHSGQASQTDSLNNSKKGIEIMRDFYNNIPLTRSMSMDKYEEYKKGKTERAMKRRLERNRKERDELREQGYMINEPEEEDAIPGDSDYSDDEFTGTGFLDTALKLLPTIATVATVGKTAYDMMKNKEGGYKKDYKYPEGKHWTSIVKKLIKDNNFKGTWKEAVDQLYRPFISDNKTATKLVEKKDRVNTTPKKQHPNRLKKIIPELKRMVKSMLENKTVKETLTDTFKMVDTLTKDPKLSKDSDYMKNEIVKEVKKVLAKDPSKLNK